MDFFKIQLPPPKPLPPDFERKLLKYKIRCYIMNHSLGIASKEVQVLLKDKAVSTCFAICYKLQYCANIKLKYQNNFFHISKLKKLIHPLKSMTLRSIDFLGNLFQLIIQLVQYLNQFPQLIFISYHEMTLSDNVCTYNKYQY